MIDRMSDVVIPRTVCFKPLGGMLICVALGAVVVAGCGSGRRTVPAGGTVTFADGHPLPHGLVTFRLMDDENPVSARGQIQPDGTFTVTTFSNNDGAVPGKHQALVAIPIVEGDMTPSPINRRFCSYETSDLEFVVTDDPKKNQFNIVVTK